MNGTDLYMGYKGCGKSRFYFWEPSDNGINRKKINKQDKLAWNTMGKTELCPHVPNRKA